jgi:hypothetical protein
MQHVEVSVPSPKKDEMLIKVEAASINPVDWKIQKGMLRPFMPPRFPFTPGSLFFLEKFVLSKASNTVKLFTCSMVNMVKY